MQAVQKQHPRNLKQELRDFGIEVDYLNASDFSNFLREQRETFTKVVTDSGILDLVKEQTN